LFQAAWVCSLANNELDRRTKPNSRNETTKPQEKIMKKTISILAIAGFILALAPAAQAAFPTSGEYRIMFLTQSNTDSSSADITTYNDFVQAEADASSVELNGVAVNSLTWNAVGSTGAVDARDNTSTNPNTDGTGVAIYDTLGNLLFDDNADLWAGDTVAQSILKLDGNEGNSRGLSGTLKDGTKSIGGDNGYWGDWRGIDTGSGYPNPTGTKYVTESITIGASQGTQGGKWIQGNTIGYATSGPVYALSEVIPEPATMSLLAIGGIALIRRRRRA
jgi:hypothetical protein